MLTARRFLVSGRVQGVGFRFFVEEAARREGVSGWVRNLPDGRVEALIEGERDAVDRLEAKLHRGPSGARVTHVERHEEPPSTDMTRMSEFEIQ